MAEEVRIDKYLWSIRVFKTRSEAAEACKSGKVTINGQEAKSSRAVRSHDRITVRKGPVRYEYLVIALIDKRQGAALVPNYATNITPQSELDKLLAPKEVIFAQRDRGAGRPTKKERREIDALSGSLFGYEDEEDDQE